jgi:Flp pilus assembly protein TadG
MIKILPSKSLTNAFLKTAFLKPAFLKTAVLKTALLKGKKSTRGRNQFQSFETDEVGSISVLIMGLFLILLTLSLGIIDLSDAYLAKRELISIGESAVSIAAQSLDQSRYYNEGVSNAGALVPIDCTLAASKFQSEIAQTMLREGMVLVTGFTCQGDQIAADISASISPAVRFPIINNLVGKSLTIQASVGAGSVVK